MTCCIEIPTPQSILDDDTRDVFEEIFPNTETYYLEMRTIMWSFYRYRGIGNCDVNYWVQNMKDRYAQIKNLYTAKFKSFGEWLSANTGTPPVDMSDGSNTYTMTTEMEDTPDNPQGTTKYLSERNTVTYNGKSFSGLSSETLGRFMEYIPDLHRQFAEEFRKQFYFGL